MPTLSRDEAYCFFNLGRSLERADMTARLVASRALAGGPRAVVGHPAVQLRRLSGVPAQLRGRGRRSPSGRVPYCWTRCSLGR